MMINVDIHSTYCCETVETQSFFCISNNFIFRRIIQIRLHDYFRFYAIYKRIFINNGMYDVRRANSQSRFIKWKEYSPSSNTSTEILFGSNVFDKGEQV